jgi:hypothetical protein
MSQVPPTVHPAAALLSPIEPPMTSGMVFDAEGTFTEITWNRDRCRIEASAPADASAMASYSSEDMLAIANASAPHGASLAARVGYALAPLLFAAMRGVDRKRRLQGRAALRRVCEGLLTPSDAASGLISLPEPKPVDESVAILEGNQRRFYAGRDKATAHVLDEPTPGALALQARAVARWELERGLHRRQGRPFPSLATNVILSGDF